MWWRSWEWLHLHKTIPCLIEPFGCSGTTFPKPGDKLVVHYICPGAQFTFSFFSGWFVGLLLLLLLLMLLPSCFTHQTKISCTDTQAKKNKNTSLFKTTTNKTMTQGRIDSKGKEPGPQIDSSYQRGLPFRHRGVDVFGWVDVFCGWVKIHIISDGGIFWSWGKHILFVSIMLQYTGL